METKDLENISDDFLLTRIQNGDIGAIENLIEKYERLLKIIIHREIRNAEAEKDIYQETCLAILRRIRRRGVTDIGSVENWLKQVARSKCKKFLVSAKKRGILMESIGAFYALAAEEMEYRRFMEEHLSEEIEEFRMFVEELGPIYVEVFDLWSQGLTEVESASMLNISPNTVKSRRNKIRKFLRERVGVSYL